MLWLFVSCMVTGWFFFRYLKPLHSRTFLNGKHVLITGGSSGIGLCLAHIARAYGANITIVARDYNKLVKAKNDVVKETYEAERWVQILQLDISETFENIDKTLSEYLSKTQPVDVLINCAGFAVAREFLDTTPDVISKLMQTNCLSSMFITKSILPIMLNSREPREKRIAFISSMAGQVALYGLAAYSASKFALRGFTDSLRMEMSSFGPRITIAFPPDTDTPGFVSENDGKPEITKKISSTAGLASPLNVAQTIMNDIVLGHYISSYGLEGTLLAWATSGVTPSVGQANSLFGPVLGAILECILATPIRAITLGLSYYWRWIVRRELLVKPLKFCGSKASTLK